MCAQNVPIYNIVQLQKMISYLLLPTPVTEILVRRKMVLGTNIPEKMARAGHFFLKILIRDWNIGPSCKNGLFSD